jgi:hypothetical protein
LFNAEIAGIAEFEKKIIQHRDHRDHRDVRLAAEDGSREMSPTRPTSRTYSPRSAATSKASP